VLSSTSIFSIKLGLDLTNLAVHFPMVFGNTVRLGDRCSCALNAALTVLPARRFAKEHDSNCHDDRPDETNAHGNSPGRRSDGALGAVVDAVGDEDAQGDEELVARYH
jgi:hypothetical protein